MKTVRDLTREQLEELKSNYFYSHLDEDNSGQCNGYDFSWDIPDDVIFEHYEGITFTDDDFFCTANNEEAFIMEAKLVECSDHDVIYGILKVHNVTIEEVQNKIYEIKNDEKFLEEYPDWCIDDVFEHFPDEWEWEYTGIGVDDVIEI